MSPPARTSTAASRCGEGGGGAYWSGSRSLFQRWMYSCRVLAFPVSLNNYLLFTLLHPVIYYRLDTTFTVRHIISLLFSPPHAFSLIAPITKSRPAPTEAARGFQFAVMRHRSSHRTALGREPRSSRTRRKSGFYKSNKTQIHLTFEQSRFSEMGPSLSTPYNIYKSWVNFLISVQPSPTKSHQIWKYI